jgi:hypothetical protein
MSSKHQSAAASKATTTISSLPGAKEKLASPPDGTAVYPLVDLPSDPDQSDWTAIRTEYNLTLPELTALKKYAAGAAQPNGKLPCCFCIPGFKCCFDLSFPSTGRIVLHD